MEPAPGSDLNGASCSSASRGNNCTLTTQSKDDLTVFTNCHGVPMHRHNNLTHKCGLPYVVPSAQYIQGPYPSPNQSGDNLLYTSTIDTLQNESHIRYSTVSAQQEQRMEEFNHGWPLANPSLNLDQSSSLLPPLDLSNLARHYNFPRGLVGISSILDQEQPEGYARPPSLDLNIMTLTSSEFYEFIA